MNINLNKYKNKGFLGALITSAIFLGIALFTFYYFYLNKTPIVLQLTGAKYDGKTSYAKDKLITAKITDIIDLDHQDEDSLDDYYVVKYTNGSASLFLAFNYDTAFSELAAYSKDLEKHPKSVVANQFEFQEDQKPELTDAINQILIEKGYSDITINPDFYLGSYIRPKLINSDTVLSIIFLALGLGFLIYSFYILGKNRVALKDLYANYPELLDSNDALERYGYYEDKLRVLVYKNHLISLAKRIMVVDLRQIRSYNTYIHSTTYYGIPTGSTYFINCLLFNNQSVKLPLRKAGKETEGRIANVYDQMQIRFENMSMNQ